MHPSTHSYLEQLRVAGSVIRRTLPCPVHPLSYQAAAKGRKEKLTGLSQKAENAEKKKKAQAVSTETSRRGCSTQIQAQLQEADGPPFESDG